MAFAFLILVFFIDWTNLTNFIAHANIWNIQITGYLSRLMTKPTKWLWAQRRLRSTLASAQSDKRLRYMLNGLIRTQSFFMWTAQTLIRLSGYPGWSESSLSAQSFCWFCHEAGHLLFLKNRWLGFRFYGSPFVAASCRGPMRHAGLPVTVTATPISRYAGLISGTISVRVTLAARNRDKW